jgi:predicted nucleic acid-binding Zn ribbon protein
MLSSSRDELMNTNNRERLDGYSHYLMRLDKRGNVKRFEVFWEKGERRGVSPPVALRSAERSATGGWRRNFRAAARRCALTEPRIPPSPEHRPEPAW